MSFFILSFHKKLFKKKNCSHNNRYPFPLPQSQPSTQLNAHFTEQKRLENKFSNIKPQQQGIRGNVTSNNKQTPPRLSTDGSFFSFIRTNFFILRK